MNDAPQDLVPLNTGEAAGFDVVLRGYDRRQVDDYCDQVDIALNESEARHAENGEQMAAMQAELREVQERLVEA